MASPAPPTSATDTPESRAKDLQDILGIYYKGEYKILSYRLGKGDTVTGRFQSGQQLFDFTLAERGIKFKLVAQEKADSFLKGYYGLPQSASRYELGYATRMDEGGTKQCTKGILCGETCIQSSDECLLDASPEAKVKTRNLIDRLKNAVSGEIKEKIAGAASDFAGNAIDIPILGDIASEITNQVTTKVLERLEDKFKNPKGKTGEDIEIDKDSEQKAKGASAVMNDLHEIVKVAGSDYINELKNMDASEWAELVATKAVEAAIGGAVGTLSANPVLGWAAAKASSKIAEQAGKAVKAGVQAVSGGKKNAKE